MDRFYNRVNFENLPSENTDLDAENLNNMDAAIEILDQRVVVLDSEKASKTELNEALSDKVKFVETTTDGYIRVQIGGGTQ